MGSQIILVIGWLLHVGIILSIGDTMSKIGDHTPSLMESAPVDNQQTTQNK